MEKILIIKLGALGDFVISIGAMFAIRRLHPDAELTLMTNKAFIGMAKKTGIFTHYIVDNRVSYLRVTESLRPLREVANGGFTRIYDLQGNKRTSIKYFTALRWMTPHSFDWVDVYKKTRRHIAKKGFGCGGLRQEAHDMELPVTDLSFLHGDSPELTRLPERYVLLICGCSPTHPYKRWPIGNFIEISQRLAQRGIAVVLIGTKAEAAEIQAVTEAVPGAVSLLNKTSLLDVPDLAAGALATIGNDTGPTHMAALTGGATLALYDYRTRFSITHGPKSENMISPSTLDLITPDMVWEKLIPHLN